jgi:lipoate-protein ligase B
MKLDRQLAGAHGYLDQLESIAVGTARAFGVDAYRRQGKSGAWTEQGKIAAIGFRLKRWVSQHGLSFNVDPDLAGFQLIVPCGLVGEPVSSLRRILGDACPTMDQAATAMTEELARVFQREVTLVGSPGARAHALLSILHELPR